MAETAMETNGDGFGGTSPSRQGAGTETSIPRNLSSMAVALRNCSGNFADSPRVFRPEALYRRRDVVRALPGPLTRRGRGQGPGRVTLLRGALVAPLRLLFGSLEASVNFWTLGFCFVQFREYFLSNFSETQKQQKIGNWHCGILSIG
jgi:hypothetical protein